MHEPVTTQHRLLLPLILPTTRARCWYYRWFPFRCVFPKMPSVSRGRLVCDLTIPISGRICLWKPTPVVSDSDRYCDSSATRTSRRTLTRNAVGFRLMFVLQYNQKPCITSPNHVHVHVPSAQLINPASAGEYTACDKNWHDDSPSLESVLALGRLPS